MMKKLTDAILGFIVGDALGVPFEFKTRAELNENPVTDMVGYGTYNQPPGTWSDDTSMTLATIENLVDWKQPEPYQCMVNFADWLFDGHFTPHGKAFDVGNTTKRAITNFVNGVQPWGLNGEYDNGNGALMRMLPFAFLPLPITERLKIARKYAAMTHSHELNLLACEFYVEVADNLIRGVDDWLLSAYSLITFYGDPTGAFDRIPRIKELTRDEIKSTGYVIDTLEAALWCFATTDNYRDCVLTAVNLGGDTDTIAAIAGGLAGLVYGEEGIPRKWLLQIARLPYIRGLLSMAEKHLVHGRFKMVQD